MECSGNISQRKWHLSSDLKDEQEPTGKEQAQTGSRNMCKRQQQRESAVPVEPECAGQRAGGGVAGGEPKRIDAEMNSARAFQAVTSVLREPWKSL